MAVDGLFPENLIPASASALLPDGYRIRPLRKSDYDAGFLDVLAVLTTVGDISKAEFEERFDWMRVQDGYYLLVVEDKSSLIVGTGAMIVERKFIHRLGLVGHIEDIAVAKDQQGKKLGLRIIQALDAIARERGCYKSILDCPAENEGFYIKCGFQRVGLEMSHYYDRKVDS